MRWGRFLLHFEKYAGDGRLCEKALSPLFVILSVAKNLVFRPFEILRFAQDDIFHTVCWFLLHFCAKEIVPCAS